jgi:hypothetical protein
MNLPDERFVAVHPATALWAVQRVDCEQCGNLLRNEEAMRCLASKSLDYCIDARLPGGVCGPEAGRKE